MNCWKRCRATETHIHCWLEFKIATLQDSLAVSFKDKHNPSINSNNHNNEIYLSD